MRKRWFITVSGLVLLVTVTGILSGLSSAYERRKPEVSLRLLGYTNSNSGDRCALLQLVSKSGPRLVPAGGARIELKDYPTMTWIQSSHGLKPLMPGRSNYVILPMSNSRSPWRARFEFQPDGLRWSLQRSIGHLPFYGGPGRWLYACLPPSLKSVPLIEFETDWIGPESSLMKWETEGSGQLSVPP